MIVATLMLAAVLPLASTGDAIFADDFDASACPPGRVEQSDVEYFDDTLVDLDMTSFDEVWGRLGAHYSPGPFPSGGSSPRILEFPMSGYIAARTSIAPEVPDYYSGRFYYSEAGRPDNPAIDFSISPRCGDFSPSLGDCVAFGALPANGTMVGWSFVGGPFSECVLETGRDYYFNIRISDPSTPSAECPNDSCVMRISSEVALP